MDRLYQILNLVDEKLEYPQWFNLNNLRNMCETEEEEDFVELRCEIKSFLQQFLKH